MSGNDVESLRDKLNQALVRVARGGKTSVTLTQREINRLIIAVGDSAGFHSVNQDADDVTPDHHIAVDSDAEFMMRHGG